MGFKVKSKVILNLKVIKPLKDAALRALDKTATTLMDDVREDEVIPRDTGALGNEKHFVDSSDLQKGVVRLVHEGPYARRLYYHPEYHFDTTKNPNAKGKWYEDYTPGGKYEDRAEEIFKGHYKREAGL